jgi:putative nucleotidyltransferase with HDIG domain
MNRAAKVYVGVVLAAGAAAIAKGLLDWHTTNWAAFVLYVLVALLASSYKLRLPGITATVSACFLLILIAILSLSMSEALIGGCVAVTFQCVWNSRSKPRPVKILFSVASIAIAITVSANVFHSQWLNSLPMEYAIKLVVLGTVYFVSSTVPVAGVIALTEGKSLWKVWSGSYFWSFAHYLVGAAVAGFFVMAQERLGWQTAMLVVPVTYLIYRSYTVHIGRVEDAKLHAEETAALHFRTIESLALAIEAKDQTTHDHLQRVRVYAVGIGEDLGMTGVELEALRAAALLHDIGKIAVPEFIISKPGKLTPEEFQKMKVHPVVGAEILERVRFPFPVAPLVRAHHEKWDGTGYPAGLKGEEIPLGARILSVVDCLDALASDRQYRKALPLSEAMAIVERDSGKAFDPRIVEILKRKYVELEHTARSSSMEPWRLSTDIQIERGGEPGAGFATSEPASGDRSAGASDPERVRLAGFLEAVASGVRFLSPNETFTIFSKRLASLVRYDSLAIFTRDGNSLTATHAAGTHAAILQSMKLTLGGGISGWVAETSRPVVNGNADLECSGLGAALSIPLSGPAGVVGVLTLYRAAQSTFTNDDLSLITGFGPSLAGYLESGSATAVWARSAEVELGAVLQ